MESSIKHCIINVGIGAWYPTGSKRLERSLIYHGYTGDILIWNEWPNDNYDKSCPYNAKAAAFEEAIKLGYTHIGWLDCSCWAVSDPNKFLNIINNDGYFLGENTGYNCAQVCNDKCLEYFGVSRDAAEKIPDTLTGCFGVNMGNPVGKFFIEDWIQAAKDGIFVSSRFHNNESQDPRFLFSRQDQMCASILAHRHGMKLGDFFEIADYGATGKENVIFALRGL